MKIQLSKYEFLIYITALVESLNRQQGAIDLMVGSVLRVMTILNYIIFIRCWIGWPQQRRMKMTSFRTSYCQSGPLTTELYVGASLVQRGCLCGGGGGRRHVARGGRGARRRLRLAPVDVLGGVRQRVQVEHARVVKRQVAVAAHPLLAARLLALALVERAEWLLDGAVHAARVPLHSTVTPQRRTGWRTGGTDSRIGTELRYF